MKKYLVMAVFALIAVSVGYFITTDANRTNGSGSNQSKTQVTMYKSPTCGCCVSHSAYLRGSGEFEVQVNEVDNLESIKVENQIPYDMQSCHTAIIGDYFVEGHVPIEAIEKLLAEKPEIDGISFPGMPAGSPGMPGVKTEEFTIYALKDGQSSEFMKI